MISLLAKIFIKDNRNTASAEVRQKYGVLCGIVGILLNIVLFAGKFIAGTISASMAVTADAFNNLSDAGSSVVTLIGFRLAGQKPDPNHPFGHGRIEYISGFIVSMLIILMGFELGKESVNKIIHPTGVEFSIVAVVILIASVAVKLYMTFYNRRFGKKFDSPTLLAVSADSMSDSVATTVVLIATLVMKFAGINIDGWCGCAVALFILWSGINSAKETLSPLLGQPPEEEFVTQIRDIVMSHEKIAGLHDLVVHNYGPGRTMITLHCEVPKTEDFSEMHDLIDNIEHDLRTELGCEAVIHMDPIDTEDEKTAETREKMAELVRTMDPVITIHDFRMVSGNTHTNLIFDIVVPFGFRLSDEEVTDEVRRLAKVLDPTYIVVCKIDKSYVK